VDLEDLEQRSESGEIVPYELELIPNYATIIRDLDKTIEKRDIIEEVA